MSLVGHPLSNAAGSAVLEDKGAHPLAMCRGELRILRCMPLTYLGPRLIAAVPDQ